MIGGIKSPKKCSATVGAMVALQLVSLGTFAQPAISKHRPRTMLVWPEELNWIGENPWQSDKCHRLISLFIEFGCEHIDLVGKKFEAAIARLLDAVSGRSISTVGVVIRRSVLLKSVGTAAGPATLVSRRLR